MLCLITQHRLKKKFFNIFFLLTFFFIRNKRTFLLLLLLLLLLFRCLKKARSLKKCVVSNSRMLNFKLGRVEEEGGGENQ